MTLPAAGVDNVGSLTFPTGIGPFPYLGTGEPSGWYLVKPGQGFVVENIADYPALAQLVGTRWGGDGITTFAMPEAGVFMRGPDGTHSLWALFGEDTHTLAAAEMPPHKHGLVVIDDGAGSSAGADGLQTSTYVEGTTSTRGASYSTLDDGGARMQTAGAGGAHNNIPLSLCVNLIVKA